VGGEKEGEGKKWGDRCNEEKNNGTEDWVRVARVGWEKIRVRGKKKNEVEIKSTEEELNGGGGGNEKLKDNLCEKGKMPNVSRRMLQIALPSYEVNVCVLD